MLYVYIGTKWILHGNGDLPDLTEAQTEGNIRYNSVYVRKSEINLTEE